jgi:hypothetical protein
VSYPNLQTPLNAFPVTYHTVDLAGNAEVNQVIPLGPTTNWFEVDSTGAPTQIPLGQSGPFLISIHNEQILCSSLTNGAAYVYEDASINGRGYNTTSIVAHNTPGSSNLDVTLLSTSVQSVVAGGNAVSSVFTRTGAVVAGNADYLAVSHGGLTGAASATRFVGGTASVAPTTGTFAVGDFVVTQAGTVVICTVAGTPGTWVNSYVPPTQAVTGSLSTVADAAAKAVLTSIISAMVHANIATSGTT